MAILVIGVRYNEAETLVTHVQWGKVDVRNPFVWVEEPKVTEAKDLIGYIDREDVVQTVFDVGGHRVLGPTLTFKVEAHGVESFIEGIPYAEGRSLKDLPRI